MEEMKISFKGRNARVQSIDVVSETDENDHTPGQTLINMKDIDEPTQNSTDPYWDRYSTAAKTIMQKHGWDGRMGKWSSST